MNSLLLILIIVILIPCFIATMFVPYWTRKTESFGVSIPASVYHQPKLQQMRKKYVLQTGILSVIITISILLSGSVWQDENVISLILGGAISIYLLVSFVLYIRFHREMKQLKAENKAWSERSQLVVMDTKFRDQKLTYSNLWFSISFIIALLTAAWTLINYDKLPARIPMQYDFSGEVTNWSEKSYRSAFLMPIMQVYLTLLFIFINTIIAKAKQQVSAVNTESSVIQNIIFRRRWSLFIIITGTAMALLFAFIQLSLFYPVNTTLMLVLPLAISIGITIGAIILSITTGQGGSRLKVQGKDNAGEIIDRDDDRYWKLGIFYFNRNDPAIFLEKRFGVGWTNNWAHPLSWIFLLVIIGLAIGIPLILG
ncbi:MULTISPECIES: DUF1648 domain-containing protein [unclassified Virgibacillus]|uniref:DUF1648 domain-containing protein n=1 Tax=unclassified Virgibacillus TaxID=2620237 RepID=UPI0024DE2794|nr:DUF1648 domain-containing protein [Virgibacillus sp. LDC-1]